MNNKTTLLAAALLAATFAAQADDLKVNHWTNEGTQTFKAPFMIDSTDVKGHAYKGDSTLTTLVAHFENARYAKVTIRVEGNRSYHLMVDGQEQQGLGTHTLTLLPQTHTLKLQYGGKAVPQLTLHTDAEGVLSLRADGKSVYTLSHVLYNTRIGGALLSPNGRYLISAYRTTLPNGSSTTGYRLTDRQTGKTLTNSPQPMTWMPRSNRYLTEQNTADGRTLIAVDPASGRQEVLADHLPKGAYRTAPTETFLIMMNREEGPKERTDVFEVIDPDDRQPGWRNRTSLSLFDLKTRQLQPLTFGHRDVGLLDIADDGSKILFSVGTRRLEKRPTSLMSLYVMDLHSLKADEIVKDDGFIASAVFSPDARQVLVCGSPECLDGIGENVKPGQTPSMFDYQLYTIQTATHKTTALTREFNPSVKDYRWSRADGMVYFTAEHKDSVCLYRLNTKDLKINRINTPEDLVEGFSLAAASADMVWWGESASNSDRLYTLNTRTMKSQLADDVSARNLKDVALGECRPWTFRNRLGDEITCRYYLPPHFDAHWQYPMIVNYYGGCSPISRNLESRYPAHAYAALGYVVLVMEPSGCTGFGQEFSARHVNAYGDYTADDIIEGTRKFCADHAWVNAKRVGCIGASYGGFMTQYLQTKTDLFAAAVSHAGISDITGYWGFGYWGYSYNEVAAADSYPWSNKELYVDHSPIYNADKIHTPLLFLHGTADHNVPKAQSVAMYTALKLLGRPTALVEVADQDHQIFDFAKRTRWEQTIYAWFARWLQDDPTWWNDMYPEKHL